MQRVDLAAELLEPSPPSSPRGGETVEEVLDSTLAELHKTFVQSPSVHLAMGEDCFPYGFMSLSQTDKAKLMGKIVLCLASSITSMPLPSSQEFKFSSEAERQRLTIAVAPQPIASQPPLLNRLLSMPETQITLQPAETRQLAGLILGAIRDSSSDVYRKQVAQTQEKLTKMGEDLLRCRERLRAKEELIMSLEMKLAGKSKSIREGSGRRD